MPSLSSDAQITVHFDLPSAMPTHRNINLAHTLEVLGWSQTLGCSEAELRLAIAEVGPDLAEVCIHLGLPSRLGTELRPAAT